MADQTPSRAGRPAKRSARSRRPSNEVLVVGLGRFGSALAQELTDLDFDVMGVDADARLVSSHAQLLTHVLEADATDVATLRQIGAQDFGTAVVGIGTDVEASILTTGALADLGVPDIWAKAVTDAHGRILQRVGAHHVVFPEHDMGQRVAHLVGGRVLDWFQLDEHFAMVETETPAVLQGMTLAEADLRARYGVTVVYVKSPGAGFTHVTADTVLRAGDLLVVAGQTSEVEDFAHLE